MRTTTSKSLHAAGVIQLVAALAIVAFWVVFFSTELAPVSDGTRRALETLTG